MSIFSVMVFVLMLMTAGIAIDTLRHEEERAELQGALDRGVLAASSLIQTEDPETVVLTYVEAAGFSRDDVEIEVHEEGPSDDLTLRRVTARTTREVDTLFLPLLGIDDLSVPGRAKAEDEKRKVEIALVLDVSGSMGDNNRIENLREAADKFVDIMSDNESIELTMSIVPYHSMVNLGDTLDGPIRLDDSHDRSSCARFGNQPSIYAMTGLPGPSDPAVGIARHAIERVAHFDMWSTNSETPGVLPNPECDVDDARAILPWTNDAAALKARIASLYPDGWTAIHLGLKWGAVMLDPWSQDVVDHLIDANVVSDDHEGRPYDYGTDGTEKFLLLMTDGSNNIEVDMRADWKGNVGSNAYVHHDTWPGIGYTSAIDGGDDYGDAGSPQYSFYFQYRADRGWNPYWDVQAKVWRSQPVGGALARELTYEQLYARFGAGYIATEMLTGGSYQPWWSQRRPYYYPEEGLDASTTNNFYSGICSAMKNAGVTIYTVGFEAPTATAGILEGCASSTSHYYTAVGKELTDRFANIALSITRLGLRQ
nr:Tad domain-containing protein [Jannaschia sp. Os4]